MVFVQTTYKGAIFKRFNIVQMLDRKNVPGMTGLCKAGVPDKDIGILTIGYIRKLQCIRFVHYKSCN